MLRLAVALLIAFFASPLPAAAQSPTNSAAAPSPATSAPQMSAAPGPALPPATDAEHAENLRQRRYLLGLIFLLLGVGIIYRLKRRQQPL